MRYVRPMDFLVRMEVDLLRNKRVKVPRQRRAHQCIVKILLSPDGGGSCYICLVSLSRSCLLGTANVCSDFYCECILE